MPPEPLVIDARGLRCPLPVLKAETALARLAPGGRLLVRATDPMARVDIPLFCRQRGYLCEAAGADGQLEFRITKPQSSDADTVGT